MTVVQSAETDDPIRQAPLRLWPGVVIVALQWLTWLGLPIVAPEAAMFAVLGGLVGGVAIVVWWAFFSRARWSDRLGGVASMLVALAATRPLLHESVATAGMGMMFFLFSVPVLSLAFVVWAAASRGLADRPRRATMVATVVVACGAWTLIRTHGVTGGGDWELDWRWAQTAEERLLSQAGEAPTAPTPAATAGAAGARWPGFRGPGRDAVVRGVRIETDWSASPPVELWRRPVGPGWSSFAVDGDLLYTQEQRGDDEVVSCYQAATGEPVWIHRDAVRFWEAMAGAGPRATPTLSGGRVYAFGATGILNALDAADGDLVWSRNVTADSGAVVPGWGFASSPLVVGDLVVVAASGQLVAYDLATGDLRWAGAAHAESYSSPHLLVRDGIEQVLLLTGAGLIGVAPADGNVLWEHPWPGFHSLQPTLTAQGDLLISSSGAAGGHGTRRLAVTHASAGWSADERWTSIGLKPYFNDLVVHRGHAYGFDGSILAAIDLEDGKRRWKGGRYGNGQLVLLADQDLLLVLSERGELALVAATPDQFLELARIPAIEGKTWNHPAVAGALLLVRNGQEMAAFRLPLAAEATRS
ncbi:MAG TPA: PQQ-binding-like beta-propeller repeat protein [Thermoanaerobaculia bacterium]|nr:PQQ-binding-like beta-propeller repeat protein [Thermoanaerobaculia bacterium]